MTMPNRTTKTNRPLRDGVPLLLFFTLASVAHAQSVEVESSRGEGPARGFSFTPRVSTSLTATDNVHLVPVDKKSDVYTQISPGFRLASNSGRIRGTVDYSLNGFLYASTSSKNQIQHALNAAVVAEAVENWAYVDINAAVSQQSISAFGTQSADPGLNTGNQTRVASYGLSPYLKGRMRGDVDYEARLRFGGSRSSSQATSDSSSQSALLRLSGLTGLSSLGWGASVSRQVDDFTTGRTTKSDRFQGRVTYAVSPQFGLSLLGGYESNNLASDDQRDSGTYGAGFNWRPSERTKLVGEAERRLFGNSHSFLFEHRMPRSSWRYSDGRDVSSGLNSSTGSVLSAYDLYFAQFASLEPDPVKREALVNSFLLSNGISPTSTVGGGFLTSALTVQRRQELSFGLTGVRSSVTLLATRTDSRRLDTLAPAVDDLSGGGSVQQTALSVNFSHRLTPASSVSLVVSEQRNKGSNSGGQSSTLRLVNVNWASRLGPQTSVSLGARHAVYDSLTVPYDETAVTGFLSLQF